MESDVSLGIEARKKLPMWPGSNVRYAVVTYMLRTSCDGLTCELKARGGSIKTNCDSSGDDATLDENQHFKSSPRS